MTLYGVFTMYLWHCEAHKSGNHTVPRLRLVANYSHFENTDHQLCAMALDRHRHRCQGENSMDGGTKELTI